MIKTNHYLYELNAVVQPDTPIPPNAATALSAVVVLDALGRLNCAIGSCAVIELDTPILPNAATALSAVVELDDLAPLNCAIGLDAGAGLDTPTHSDVATALYVGVAPHLLPY